MVSSGAFTEGLGSAFVPRSERLTALAVVLAVCFLKPEERRTVVVRSMVADGVLLLSQPSIQRDDGRRMDFGLRLGCPHLNVLFPHSGMCIPGTRDGGC
mmetsp:Transcript_40802/g.85728  ORF Transcript_40802/g.85728 Transcript_40802/m.85728 type:complete len:99 (-) Transcript_40802:254-550(-)